MGKLQHLASDKQFVLHSDNSVGRAPESTLRLDHRSISWRHAQIRWAQRGWEIRDLGSRNGTFVDGERLPASKSVCIERDSCLVIGTDDQRWQVIDASPPDAFVRCIGGSDVVFADNGVIKIPSEGDGDFDTCILRDASGWRLESPALCACIEDGFRMQVAGQAWRFHCPTAADDTCTSDGQPLDIAKALLRFKVSSDEEHVEVWVDAPEGEIKVGSRSCGYLGLCLARQRLRDRERGLSEHGWMPVETLLSMLPEYASPQHLSVAIFRLRRMVSSSGHLTPGEVVERRAGQVRLGLNRVVVETLRD